VQELALPAQPAHDKSIHDEATQEAPPPEVGPLDAPAAPAMTNAEPLPLDLRPLPARATVPETSADLSSQSTVVRKPTASSERHSAERHSAERHSAERLPPEPLPPMTLSPPPGASQTSLTGSMPGSLSKRPAGGGLIFGLAAVTVAGIVVAGVVTVVLVILLVWALLSL
jgi:hypothetical protein